MEIKRVYEGKKVFFTLKNSNIKKKKSYTLGDSIPNTCIWQKTQIYKR